MLNWDSSGLFLYLLIQFTLDWLCCFAEADPSHTYTSAVVFLPLLLVSLASVGFFCFRRSVKGFSSSSIFNLWVRLCLTWGNMFVQEQGQDVSENTATPRPPQRHFWQPLQGNFKEEEKKKKLYFLIYISWLEICNCIILTLRKNTSGKTGVMSESRTIHLY